MTKKTSRPTRAAPTTAPRPTPRSARQPRSPVSNDAAVRTIVTPGPRSGPQVEDSWLDVSHQAGPVVDAPAPAPDAPPPDTGRREVVKGDTLWDIAAAVYGDPLRWTEIYEANKEVIGDNPNLILPGQKLDLGGLQAPDVETDGPTLDLPELEEGPGVDVPEVDAPRVDIDVPSLDIPIPDTAPSIDPSSGVLEAELTEREIHDARVEEILGAAYDLEPGSDSFEAMQEWLDPLGSAPSASDYLTPAMVQAGYEINSDGKLEYAGAVVSGGENAIGVDAVSNLGGLDLAVGAHAAWDQTDVGVQTSSGHYTASANAIDFLGGPIGTASETDVWDWSLEAGGEFRAVSLNAEASRGASDVSAFHTAIQNFPIDGLSQDVTDPVSMVARQAYIDANPEEFQEWMLERREAVVGDAESVSDFDWQNLGAGEAASFSEFGENSWAGGAGYMGVGVSLGRSEEDAHEVTMAMDDAGMLDVAITAMDQGAVNLGLSAFGTLELGLSAGEGHVSQVRFRIDTSTADGRQQADLFTNYGLLPGALDTVDAETRAEVEEYLGFVAGREAHPGGDWLRPPVVDIAAIAAGANAQFLENHEEGDLPTPGDTSYENMELADIRTSGATIGVASGPIGLTLLESSYMQILAENRYRNEQGLTESEFSANTSVDRGALNIGGWQPFGDGTQVDSFAITNPEEREDIALFAGVSGDYGHDMDIEDGQQAAYTVTLDDAQMAGLEQYLDEIDGAEEALFNEDAAEYFFTTWDDPVRPQHISYEGHDGDDYSYKGNITEDNSNLVGIGNSDAETRAGWMGLSGHVDQTAIDLYADEKGLNAADVTIEDMIYELDRYRFLAAGVIDMQFRDVTSIQAFRDLEDPVLQSAYIQSSAIRLSYEDKNPALAFSLAFELEDPKARNEVIRDVLAHLPEDGVEYVGSLIEDARAHDPELAALLEGAIEEGAIDTPSS